MAIAGSIKMKTQDSQEGHTPQTALFISKVWNIVNQSSTDKLISWSESGKTFIVHQEAAFSKQILPHYFKHSNFTSFVRQLNLYGFRKVAKPDQGGLMSITDDSVEFWHTNFRRGHPELLPLVQRRHVIKQEEKNPNVSRVMSDIHQMKEKQENIATLLDELKDENFYLKQQVMLMKEKHDVQHKLLNKIIHFVIQMLYKGRMPLRKNRLMLTDTEEDLGYLPPSKRSRNALDHISIHPSSPPLLSDPSSPGFPFIEDVSPIPDPLESDIHASHDILQLPEIPDASSGSLDTSSSTNLISGDVFLADLFQQTTTADSSSPPSSSSQQLLLKQEPTRSQTGSYQPQSQPLSLPTSVNFQPQPKSTQSQSQSVDVVPYNNKVVNHVATHLDSHQAELESFPDALLDHLDIDPSLLSGLLTMDYVQQIPEYDTIDTARLLESLMDPDPEKDVCHESRLPPALMMGQLPALPPGEADNTLEELLAVVSTASGSSSSTKSVSTYSTPRVET